MYMNQSTWNVFYFSPSAGIIVGPVEGHEASSREPPKGQECSENGVVAETSSTGNKARHERNYPDSKGVVELRSFKIEIQPNRVGGDADDKDGGDLDQGERLTNMIHGSLRGRRGLACLHIDEGITGRTGHCCV